MSPLQKLTTIAKSTLCLITAFALLQFLQWVFMLIGAYFSSFEGQIKYDAGIISATAENWNLKQVVAIFLFPDIVFFLLFIFFFLQKIKYKHAHKLFSLFKGWLFLLITVKILFIPVLEIFNKKGIYYLFLWIDVSLTYQYVFALILLLYFLFNVFKFSAVFSLVIDVHSKQFVKPKFVLSNIILLWYIPALILSTLILVVSKMQITFPNDYFIIGLFVVIFINTFYVVNYKVIVN